VGQFGRNSRKTLVKEIVHLGEKKRKKTRRWKNLGPANSTNQLYEEKKEERKDSKIAP